MAEPKKALARLLVLFVTLYAGVGAGSAAEPDARAVAGVAEAAVRSFIVPGYGRLAQQAELAVIKFDQMCKNPSPDALATAREQFGALVRAWGRVELVRFGPVLEDNRLERILFYPDRRGLGQRQVERLLATQSEAGTDLAQLRAQSVAVQGLGALEYVLFGRGAEILGTGTGAYRCQYGKTIARAIWQTGEDLVDAWLRPDGTLAHMSYPQPGFSDYRDAHDVLTELVGIYVHGAELLRDARLGPLLGQTRDGAKPKSALFWRSDLTLDVLKANAGGLKDLFIISGLGELVGEDGRWAAGALVFELDNFSRAASDIARPLEKSILTPKGWGEVNYLRIVTRSLQNIMAGQIAADLGVGVGFSTLDGD